MKKIVTTLIIIMLFGGLTFTDASAKNIPSFNPAVFNPATYLNSALTSINMTGFLVKSGAYKESEDPLMRRGTQNTDSPQGVFLVLPFVLTVVFFIVLFTTKKK